jgi:hypothetical protein
MTVVFVPAGFMTSGWYVWRAEAENDDSFAGICAAPVSGGTVGDTATGAGSIVGVGGGDGVTMDSFCVNGESGSIQPEQNIMTITIAQVTGMIAGLRIGTWWRG